jgi:uncharacterized membrane protein
MSATPTAAAPDKGTEGLRLVLPGRSCPGGAGWDWIAQGWALFVRSPLMWIVALVIVIVIAIVVHLVPLIGSLAFQLFQGVIGAGFVVACRSLETGGQFELEHLFAGFQRHLGQLVLVGVFLLIGWILIFLVFAAIVGFSILGAVIAGGTQDITAAILASGVSILLGTLVMLALMVPLLAAYWFAPALVIMHGLSAGEAMKASFHACFRNLMPFLVYSIIMTVFAFIAVLPFGLGMLVWIPVAIASTYAAYRQIFTDDDYRPIPVPVPPEPPPAKMV